MCSENEKCVQLKWKNCISLLPTYIIKDIRTILSSSLEHYTFPIQLFEFQVRNWKMKVFPKCFYWGLVLWVTPSISMDFNFNWFYFLFYQGFTKLKLKFKLILFDEDKLIVLVDRCIGKVNTYSFVYRHVSVLKF